MLSENVYALLKGDIVRFLTIRINKIDEKPSPIMNNKTDRQKYETIDENTNQPVNSDE